MAILKRAFAICGLVLLIGTLVMGIHTAAAQIGLIGGAQSIVPSGELPGAPVSNGIYVNTGDVLWFQITGPGGNMTFSFRMQMPDGRIYDSAQQGTSWTINGCGAAGGGYGTGIFFPTPGWLIGAQVISESAGLFNGTFYAQGYLLRSMPTGGNNTSCQNILAVSNYGVALFGCNSSSFFSVGWSVGGGCLIQSPLTGPGYPLNTNIGNPGAGSNLALTAIGAQQLRVIVNAVHFRLVTSAAAASRQVCITFGTAGGVILTTLCSAGTQAASQTVDYDFMAGPGGSCPATLITGTACLTGFSTYYPVQGGTDDSLATAITGIQAADQISNIWVKTLRWNEND
jgi:hypothetical protein